MTISIHDGVIIGYSVSFLENELILDIETVADEIVTVKFENYLAHDIQHVMAGSILFDIEEADLNTFFVENREQFGTINYMLGRFASVIRMNSNKTYKKNNYKCYVIFASLGLSGYVFAKSFKVNKGMTSLPGIAKFCEVFYLN